MKSPWNQGAHLTTRPRADLVIAPPKVSTKSRTQLDWFVEGLQSLVHGLFIASMCHFASAGLSLLICHRSRQL